MTNHNRSKTLSTRDPRLPAGCKASDIFRRVRIAVVPGSAIGTRPVPHRQRHFGLVRTAVATGLATWEPAVYHHHAPPVPRGFVLDLPSELAHADIRNRAAATARTQIADGHRVHEKMRLALLALEEVSCLAIAC